MRIRQEMEFLEMIHGGNKMELGNKIKAVRLKAGITQERLANGY